jgi:hypothetical protein
MRRAQERGMGSGLDLCLQLPGDPPLHAVKKSKGQ